MRTKELGSNVEGKAADSKPAPDTASHDELHPSQVRYYPSSASQPGGVPVPQVHAPELDRRPDSQSARGRNHLLQLQRLYGNRYVQRMVNLGRDSDDAEATVSKAGTEKPVMASSEAVPRAAGPDLQQQLDQAKGTGAALPQATRSSLESAFGADFRNVSIHTGPDAVEMNQQLGAQAFTYGSDIYFNEGKYDPESSSGRQLLAHELTHTLQQGATQPHTREESGDVQASYSTTETPNIQAAWYNFRIPFTDYEFDPSIEGIKTAAGVVADKAQEGATWVKDKVVEGVEWVFDRISELINAGINWLKDKFTEIKEFATSSFDTIKTALSNILTQITSPMTSITGAFASMDAALLGSAWRALSSGANAAWQAIKGVVNGVLKVGTGIWNTVSGFVTSLFDGVGSLLDSTPFKLLPEFLQSGARKLYTTVRSLWESIRDFWNDFWQRLTSFVRDLLASIESFVQRVVSFAIDAVITTVKTLKEVYDFVQLVFSDPEAFVRPVVEHIAGKIESEAPQKAREAAQQKMSEAWSSAQSSRSATATIQRSPDGKVARTTATRDEVNATLARTFADQWAALSIRKMLWETFVNLFWPPATIRAIGHEFSELWNKDWANTVDSLFLPRNILDDFGGFFHDLWSNILILLDFPLALWRRLNAVLMLLMGYVTIILVIVGAVGGAIVGNVPGAIAGAAAGLKLALAIGEALFVSFLLAESISALKAFLDLFTARQTQKDKDRDYLQIAGSTIGIGIAIVIAVIFALLGSLVSRIAASIKARAALRPPPPAPPKQLGPGAEPPKQLGPGPEPPKTEPPKPEAPIEEPPKPEAPVEEPPKPEVPKEEPPKPEIPKEEPPKPEAPVEEPPKPEVPVEEPPKPEPPGKKPPKEKPPAEKPDLKDLTIEELVREGDKRARPKETKEAADARVKAARAEAQRRGYCFVAGTLVQTPAGPRPIETLVAGQMVLVSRDDNSVQESSIVELMRSSSRTLYHLEIAETLRLDATSNHPFFVPGRGWTKAKDLVIGDQLLSLDHGTVSVSRISRESLLGPVDTFNLHVDGVHNYFVGNGPAVLVHNGPVNNPELAKPVVWGLGAKGPRQRMPSPTDPTIVGDTDGASGWRTNSVDEAGRLLGVRNLEGGTGNHGAITDAQLASKGLVAVDTKGTGALAEAGFQHVSIRPETNPDASKPLTEAEMAEVKAKLEELAPVAQNKPADFLC